VPRFHKYNKQRELNVLLLPLNIFIYGPQSEWYKFLKDADEIFVEISPCQVISLRRLTSEENKRAHKGMKPAKSYINNIKPRCELVLSVSRSGMAPQVILMARPGQASGLGDISSFPRQQERGISGDAPSLR
jgi:hypothetical protein